MKTVGYSGNKFVILLFLGSSSYKENYEKSNNKIDNNNFLIYLQQKKKVKLGI